MFDYAKILSNSTLDAAKTNRAVQLVQSETSKEVLFALAYGLLTGQHVPAKVIPTPFVRILKGVCTAFSMINAFAASTKEELFHLRDFVLMLRYL